jgi:hypothetical protein
MYNILLVLKEQTIKAKLVDELTTTNMSSRVFLHCWSLVYNPVQASKHEQPAFHKPV